MAFELFCDRWVVWDVYGGWDLERGFGGGVAGEDGGGVENGGLFHLDGSDGGEN